MVSFCLRFAEGTLSVPVHHLGDRFVVFAGFVTTGRNAMMDKINFLGFRHATHHRRMADNAPAFITGLEANEKTFVTGRIYFLL